MSLFQKKASTDVLVHSVAALLVVAILLLSVSAQDIECNDVLFSSLAKRTVVVEDRNSRTAPRRTLFPSLQRRRQQQQHSHICRLVFCSTMALTHRGGGIDGGRRKTVKTPKALSSGESCTSEGQSTIVSSVFNLVNNVAGAGILTLSAGMAPGTGYGTAIIICAMLGWWSGHCFVMVGQACELTSQGDFKGLWKTTLGADSAWVVDAVIAIMCLACSIIYSGILGDVFTPLLAQAGFPSQYNGRTSNS
jgi:hypothetical protein